MPGAYRVRGTVDGNHLGGGRTRPLPTVRTRRCLQSARDPSEYRALSQAAACSDDEPLFRANEQCSGLKCRVVDWTQSVLYWGIHCIRACMTVRAGSGRHLLTDWSIVLSIWWSNKVIKQTRHQIVLCPLLASSNSLQSDCRWSGGSQLFLNELPECCSITIAGPIVHSNQLGPVTFGAADLANLIDHGHSFNRRSALIGAHANPSNLELAITEGCEEALMANGLSKHSVEWHSFTLGPGRTLDTATLAVAVK